MEEIKNNHIMRLRRFFSDNQFITFMATVAAICLIVYWTAINIPALIVAILLAYLLDSIVEKLINMGAPRMVALSGALSISILSLAYLMLIGIPQVAAQLTRFFKQLPETVPKSQQWLADRIEGLNLGENFSTEALFSPVREWISGFGETAISATLSNVVNLFNIVVYIVLIPLLLFFVLRDKQAIMAWLGKFLPKSIMLTDLRSALDEQFGAYVRGKIIEGAIIFVLSLIGFLILGVNYALVLAVAIGLSVIIPMVGGIAVTIPVVVAGLVQFGLSSELWWMLGIYTVIQILDGQLLVPLLFSEVVKIHPAAILVAILFFGAIWGVWGVFFAIPLASLIKSVVAVVEKHFDPNGQPA